MCKLGDIILVDSYISNDNKKNTKHSFVVINDEKNTMQGLEYDFVANVLLSFHSEEHKQKKLKIKSNLMIKDNSIKGKHLNLKQGYIRADELYYFNKNKIKYKIIAHMDSEMFNQLMVLIFNLKKDDKIINVANNL